MSIFARIAAAIFNAMKLGVTKACSIVEWLEQKLLGSTSGAGTPSYTPSTSRSDIVEELQLARAVASNVRNFDPSGIEIVKKFCAAPQHFRDGMDLSTVNADARALLLTMDDHELKALGEGGPGQIRKFLVGRDHGLHGVPVVGVHLPGKPVRSKPKTVAERVAWQVEALEMKPRHSAAFRSPR